MLYLRVSLHWINIRFVFGTHEVNKKENAITVASITSAN
jgi:hypothetical protein